MFRKLLLRSTLFIVACVVALYITILFLPKPGLYANPYYSQAIYDDNNQLLRLTLAADEQYRLFTPITTIPKPLTDATLLQEDRYFYYHFGLNPIAMLKAAWNTYFIRSRKTGASTITMQLARMRFGIYSKNISGKLMQLFRALQLEHDYSKNEILEAYLNTAPYGGNVQGVGAASLIYFGKPVQKLALPQMLTLAVIPQNPLKRIPRQQQNQVLKTARDKLYERWLKIYPATAGQTAAMKLPLQLKSASTLPFLTPHFVNMVLKNNPVCNEAGTACHNYNNITTTLNLKLQNVLERINQQYLTTRNYTNSAALLIDTNTMAIKAMIGSEDFFNQQISGQVNGILMKRSPGSTLKPFIYALALQQGLIHPLSILKDTPQSFGAYDPENFDKDFAGPINATDALVASRNIPALTLMAELHNPTFYQFLQQANISKLNTEKHYGLSLALGGAEVSMAELIQLYAMLANDGVLKPLRYTDNQHIFRGKRLLSAEAAFLVLDMLKQKPPPYIVYASAVSKTLPVAWKTGTSSRYRDGWAVGVFGHYALAVWIGDFNNRGGQYTGFNAAAPLFFSMLNAITAQKLIDVTPHPKQIKNLNLVRVSICKESGLLPTATCPKTTDTWFIPGVSPIKSDTVFREILIDSKTGLRTCFVNQDTKFAVYEFWTSDLLSIFAKAGIRRKTPPPYDPRCIVAGKTDDSVPPQIISPRHNLVYSLRAGNSATIPFSAIADANVKTIYWFVDQKYVGKSTPNLVFAWQARPGHYTVRAVDDSGRAAARDLKVEVVQ